MNLKKIEYGRAAVAPKSCFLCILASYSSWSRRPSATCSDSLLAAVLMIWTGCEQLLLPEHLRAPQTVSDCSRRSCCSHVDWKSQEYSSFRCFCLEEGLLCASAWDCEDLGERALSLVLPPFEPWYPDSSRWSLLFSCLVSFYFSVTIWSIFWSHGGSN